MTTLREDKAYDFAGSSNERKALRTFERRRRVMSDYVVGRMKFAVDAIH